MVRHTSVEAAQDMTGRAIVLAAAWAVWAAWGIWITQQAGTRLRRAAMARMTRVDIHLRPATGLALEAGLSQMNPIRTGVRDL